MAKGKTVTQNNAMQCEAMVHGFKPHLCLEGGKVGMKVAYTSKEEVRSNNSSTRHSVRLRIHAVLQLASMGVQTPLTTVTTLSAQASPPQRGRPGFPQLKDIFPLLSLLQDPQCCPEQPLFRISARPKPVYKSILSRR